MSNGTGNKTRDGTETPPMSLISANSRRSNTQTMNKGLRAEVASDLAGRHHQYSQLGDSNGIVFDQSEIQNSSQL